MSYPDGNGNIIEGTFAGYVHYSDVTGMMNSMKLGIYDVECGIELLAPKTNTPEQLAALEHIGKAMERARASLEHYGSTPSFATTIDVERDLRTAQSVFESRFSNWKQEQAQRVRAGFEKALAAWDQWDDACRDASRCKHCGIIGGH